MLLSKIPPPPPIFILEDISGEGDIVDALEEAEEGDVSSSKMKRAVDKIKSWGSSILKELSDIKSKGRESDATFSLSPTLQKRWEENEKKLKKINKEKKSVLSFLSKNKNLNPEDKSELENLLQNLELKLKEVEVKEKEKEKDVSEEEEGSTEEQLNDAIDEIRYLKLNKEWKKCITAIDEVIKISPTNEEKRNPITRSNIRRYKDRLGRELNECKYNLRKEKETK